MNLRFLAIFKRATINDLWKLFIVDTLKVVEKASSTFCNINEVEKYVWISLSEYELKTKNELGYLHAEILPKLQMAYYELGYSVNNEIAAKNQLKYDYGYFEEAELLDRKTGEIIKQQIQKSFSKAGKKELAKIMEFAIMICLEAGIEVEKSETYKNRN